MNVQSKPSHQPPKARGRDENSELLLKIGKDRNKKDFIPLFRHYAPMMKAYAVRMGLGHKAEEMTQEVMLQIWRKAEKFNPEKASATTWIYTVARNLMIDELRQKKGDEVPLESEDIWNEDDDSEPLISFQRYSTEKHLKDSLETLPFDQKTLITQVYLSGKTQQQLADELDIPLGTVKSRIRLALGKLKLNLKKYEL